MGADIHMYIEHREPGRDHWFSFGERINPGRDYGLFGYIAGVRHEVEPVVPLRGYPADAGYSAQHDNHLLINDEYGKDGDGWCTEEQARNWVKSGCSKRIPAKRDEKNQPMGADKVTHPDWHSHTWLTADELERAINAIESDAQRMKWPNSKVDVEYHGVIGAMRAMEAKGREVRAVIWFDN